MRGPNPKLTTDIRSEDNKTESSVHIPKLGQELLHNINVSVELAEVSPLNLAPHFVKIM